MTLHLKDLSVTFKTEAGPLEALRNVSLSLRPGEAIGIVGESGSGKSTICRAIMRLMPQNASARGEIFLENKDLLKHSEKEMEAIRGKSIAMIFQDPMSALNPTLTIGYQVAEGIQLHRKLSYKEAREEALKLLHRVGIPNPEERYNDFPHTFSGGQRQRIVIAAALGCNPSILLADEPTTALDHAVQEEILNLLKELQQERGLSLILVTHDLEIAAAHCDTVCVLYGGKIVERASGKNLLKAPQHPYTRALLNALPRENAQKSRRLQAIPGSPPQLCPPPSGCPFHPRCGEARRICQRQMPHETILEDEQAVACWLQHLP